MTATMTATTMVTDATTCLASLDLTVWDVVIAVAALHAFSTARDMQTRAIILACVAVAAYILHHGRKSTTTTQPKIQASDASSSESRHPPLPGSLVRIEAPDVYPLSDVIPARLRLPHLARHHKLAGALERLAPYVARNRGFVQRAQAALETFFELVDRHAIVQGDSGGGGGRAKTKTKKKRTSTPLEVAMDVRTLRDLRADALNALAALEWARPKGLAGAVHRASALTRRETLGALRQVIETNLAVSSSPHVLATDWRAPYAFDGRSSPHEMY